jgi:hypothetical protein
VLAFTLSRGARRRPAPPRDPFELEALDAEPGAEPVIRLVREPASDRLAVEVMGARYHRLSDIQDDELRRQVMLAAAEMVDFTGVLDEGEPVVLSPDQAIQWREDLRRALPRREPDATAEFLDKAARQSEQEGLAPVTLVGALQRALQGKTPDSAETLSLVEEIDQIVQRRLNVTRGLQGRTLKLRAVDAERIVYEFDGAEYGAVDDIPNHTARLLVQDSIREWEETR